MQRLDQRLNLPDVAAAVGIGLPEIRPLAPVLLGDGVRLDAAISALPTLQGAVQAGKPIKLVGDPLYYEPLAAAIDKEAPSDPKPLLDEMSRIIEEMHKDGTLTKLSEKWYEGTDLTTKQ